MCSLVLSFFSVIRTNAQCFQDASTRYVMEYSNDAGFANLDVLDTTNVHLQSAYPFANDGADMEDAFLTDSDNSVIAGRFLYTKDAIDQEFFFPKLLRLRLGRAFYFRNYRVHNNCFFPGEKV